MKKEFKTKNDAHYIGFHFGLYTDWCLDNLKKYFPEWRIFKAKQYVGEKKGVDVLFIVPDNFKRHSRDKLILSTSHSYPYEYIKDAIEAFEKQYKQRYEFSTDNINFFVQIQFMYIPRGTTILQLGRYKSK